MATDRPVSALGSVLLSDAEVAAAGGYCQQPTVRMTPRGDKAKHTWGRVDALGLEHLAKRPDTCWAVAPSMHERRMLDTLLGKAKERVRTANDPAKLGTALTYVEKFARSLPSRPLWRRRSGGPEDWSVVAHNDQTFVLLTEFIRLHGSTRPGQIGRTLPADTVSEYVGVVRAAMTAELGGALTDGDAKATHGRQQKSMAIEDGPRKAVEVSRARRLGFRGQHFRRVAASTFDRTSTRGAFRWMLSLMMYACIMRAGEPGRGKGSKPFNVQRGVKLSDIVWLCTLQTGTGLRAVVFMLVTSKVTMGRYERYPTEVSEREGGRSDPQCPYSRFREYWEVRARAVCTRTVICSSESPLGFCEACSTAPLYVDERGIVPTTSSCMLIIRDMCEAIGEPPGEYTGYSLRIGAASDLVEMLGEERAAVVTKRMGRWKSDIFHIYERNGAGELLRASASMADAEGRSLESLLPRWSQPARRWAH